MRKRTVILTLAILTASCAKPLDPPRDSAVAVEPRPMFTISARSHGYEPLERATLHWLATDEVEEVELTGVPVEALYPLGYVGDLVIAAPGHEPVVVPIWPTSRRYGLRLSVTLRPNRPPAEGSPVLLNIQGDADAWGRRRTVERAAMVARDDGTYSVRLRGRSGLLRYLLSGFTRNGHLINGTQHDFLEYDRAQDFWSVIRVPPETAPPSDLVITFDPSLLPLGAEFSAVVETSDPELQLAINWKLELDDIFQRHLAHQLATGELPERDWLIREFIDRTLVELEWLPRPVQQHRLIKLAGLPLRFSSPEERRRLYDRFLTVEGSDSPFQVFSPNSGVYASRVDPARFEIENVSAVVDLARHPHPLVRLLALNALGLHSFDRNESVDRWVEEMRALQPSVFFDVERLVGRFKLKWLDQELPEFAWQADDGSMVTNQSHSGWLLLDVSRVDCKYCRDDAPILAKLASDFPELTLVTLEQYPRTALGLLPVPWVRVFLQEQRPVDDLLREFQTAPTPYRLLVRNGVVFAEGPQLKRDSLYTTLTQHIGAPCSQVLYQGECQGMECLDRRCRQ